MASPWALFNLLFRVGLLVIAIVFTVQTSRGDTARTRVVKFLGLVLSIVPVVGLLFYVGLRHRRSGYGEKCGTMALLGVLLYALITAESTFK